MDARDASEAAIDTLARCDDIAACTEEPGRIARTFLARPAMERVHAFLTLRMEAVGMAVRVDGLGNLVGRREGTIPGAPTLLIGSHLDTVPDAGRYDGLLG